MIKPHFFTHPKTAFVLSTMMALLLGWVDYASGREFGFFVFYFLPISYAAWFAGVKTGGAIAVLSAAVWCIADLMSMHATSFFTFWNTLIRLISFLLISFFVDKISMLLLVERMTSDELRQALSQIKTLRGLIPICASCKKIRNDQGYWEHLEKYIGEHSEADFTHGLCEACARKLYPSIYEKDTSGVGGASTLDRLPIEK